MNETGELYYNCMMGTVVCIDITIILMSMVECGAMRRILHAAPSCPNVTLRLFLADWLMCVCVCVCVCACIGSRATSNVHLNMCCRLRTPYISFTSAGVPEERQKGEHAEMRDHQKCMRMCEVTINGRISVKVLRCVRLPAVLKRSKLWYYKISVLETVSC